jgi:DNA-directed RNA polymerase III subunit RPC6
LSSDSEDDEDEDERPRKKSKKRRKAVSDDDSSSSSEHERRSKKSSKSMKHSSSPAAFDLDMGSGGSVYRALREETGTIGLTESPCGLCPSFEFCKEGGPVNPQECVYYGEWLVGGTMTNEEEAM